MSNNDIYLIQEDGLYKVDVEGGVVICVGENNVKKEKTA